MLRAYANMPIADFIAQLRTYVIAMGLSTQVVDCVDRLTDVDEMKDAHADELREAEEESEQRGRKSMKAEIIDLLSEHMIGQELTATDILAFLREVEV